MLALSASTFAWSGRGAFGQASDRGIGGTGTPGVAEQENHDRGIGGTGVIGTIRKFGSIVVNGLRITYAKNIPVRIDGREASASQLRIGHVVRVVADQRGGVYSTHAIDVVNEVVGDIDSISGNHLVVLGQTVSTANLSRGHRWTAGDHVAVSGLRRPDGVIVASLIERRSDAPEQVAGPISQASDGSLRIGDLKLMGVDAAMIGQRALLTGKLADGVFAVTESRAELGILRSEVSKVLVRILHRIQRRWPLHGLGICDRRSKQLATVTSQGGACGDFGDVQRRRHVAPQFAAHRTVWQRSR